MTNPTKNDLDPFRAIVGVLANRGDSDLLVGVVTAAGLQVDIHVSDDEEVSHRTRIRALLPRIIAAYDALDAQAKLTVASVAISNFGDRYWETRAHTVEALSKIGWILQGDDLVVGSPDLREMFFPKGSPWDAHVALRTVFDEAKSTLTIIDAYADTTLFQMLAKRPLAGLIVRILCSKYASSVVAEAKAFMAQHSGVTVEVREAKDFHDRFIIIDGGSCVHVGSSIKDAGKTACMVSRVEDPANSAAIVASLEASWNAATPLL
jgi:hypothetical protein